MLTNPVQKEERESKMKRKRGFTLIELLVVITIIAMLLAILMPALNKVKKIAMRVICGTRLKGLGTAHTVYAHENDEEWVVASTPAVTNNWVYTTPTPGWQNLAGLVGPGITVGSSLYLLVRNADVSPKSFVCAASTLQWEFDGKNIQIPPLDIVQLWDFGSPASSTVLDIMGPRNCVSYSYHMPYATAGKKSSRAVDGTRNSSFAAMADMNPWFDPKIANVTTPLLAPADPAWTEKVGGIGDYWNKTCEPSSPNVRIGNAFPHDRVGQNVLYIDGHIAFAETPDVGVRNDNIYTNWSAAATPLKERIGTLDTNGGTIYRAGAGTAFTPQPQGNDDSFLVNDNRRQN